MLTGIRIQMTMTTQIMMINWIMTETQVIRMIMKQILKIRKTLPINPIIKIATKKAMKVLHQLVCVLSVLDRALKFPFQSN